MRTAATADAHGIPTRSADSIARNDGTDDSGPLLPLRESVAAAPKGSTCSYSLAFIASYAVVMLTCLTVSVMTFIGVTRAAAAVFSTVFTVKPRARQRVEQHAAAPITSMSTLISFPSPQRQARQGDAQDTSLLAPTGFGWRRGEPTLGLMAIFKNEAMWMTEWLTHYAEEGVSQFVLLDQGSTDNGPALARAFGQRRSDLRLQVFDDGVRPNEQELNYGRHIRFVTTDWLLIVDLDEMMYARKGYSTLTQYLAGLPSHISLVAVAWKLFGSSGQASHPVSGVHRFRFRRKVLETTNLHHQKWHEAVEFKCLARLATLRSHLGLAAGEPITPRSLPFGRIEIHQVIPLTQTPEPELLKAMHKKPPYDRIDWQSSTGTAMQLYLPDMTNATPHQPTETISLRDTSRIMSAGLDGYQAWNAARAYLSRKKMNTSSMMRPIAKLLINSSVAELWPVHLNHYRTGSCEYWHRIKKSRGVALDAAFVRSRSWKMFRELDMRSSDVLDDELARKRGPDWPTRARAHSIERLWPDGRPYNSTAILNQRDCDATRCPTMGFGSLGFHE